MVQVVIHPFRAEVQAEQVRVQTAREIEVLVTQVIADQGELSSGVIFLDDQVEGRAVVEVAVFRGPVRAVVGIDEAVAR